MSDENERSVASTGSVGPVAWAVTPQGRDDEIDCEFIYPDEATAGDVAADWGVVVPLYRHPRATVRLPREPKDFEISEANGYAAAIEGFRRALASAGIEWVE